MADIYIVAEEIQRELKDKRLDAYGLIAHGGIDRLSAQATELLGSADAAEVTDQATLDKVAELLKETKRLQKDFEAARKAAVEPLNAVVKGINTAAKEVFDERGKTGRLNEAELLLKNEIATYLEANPGAKADGVYTAGRFGYEVLDKGLLKPDYLAPNDKAISAVVTAMGPLAEKVVSRRKTVKAIEVHKTSELRVRSGE